MSTHFRFVLRQASQDRHDTLDAEISSLSFDDVDDYARFLSLHHLCFAALDRGIPKGDRSADLLAELQGLIRADLAALDHDLPDIGTPDLGSLDPLAVRYVVDGSRLGSRVLVKRWASACSGRTADAGQYLSHETSPDSWRATCDALGEIPPESDRATRIIADVARIFDMFTVVLNTLKKNAAKGVMAAQ